MTGHRQSATWGSFCLLWIEIVQHESAVTLDDGLTYWLCLDDVVQGRDERVLARKAHRSMIHHSREELWCWLHRELDQRLFIHAVVLRSLARVERGR